MFLSTKLLNLLITFVVPFLTASTHLRPHDQQALVDFDFRLHRPLKSAFVDCFSTSPISTNPMRFETYEPGELTLSGLSSQLTMIVSPDPNTRTIIVLDSLAPLLFQHSVFSVAAFLDSLRGQCLKPFCSSCIFCCFPFIRFLSPDFRNSADRCLPSRN